LQDADCRFWILKENKHIEVWVCAFQLSSLPAGVFWCLGFGIYTFAKAFYRCSYAIHPKLRHACGV
ncbi:MAG: hypothetical protein P8X90_29060, partial [Desulfobacterales bacterium]